MVAVMWGWTSLEFLLQDLRYGLRMLRKGQVATFPIRSTAGGIARRANLDVHAAQPALEERHINDALKLLVDHRFDRSGGLRRLCSRAPRLAVRSDGGPEIRVIGGEACLLGDDCWSA